MRNKIIMIITLSIFLSFTNSSVGAENSIPMTMYMNGNYIPSDVQPVVLNGITYISLKAFTEAIGVKDVTFNNEDKSITISNGIKDIKLFIDEKRILVNNNEYITSSMPRIINNRTMVSIEFILEIFLCNVNIDDITKSILFTKSDLNHVTNPCENGYTPEDVLWLSRIVHVEANGAEYACKLGVANVVINRKNSSRFPNSIYDVIFQPGQFPPAYKNGFSTFIPSSQAIKAAKEALNGENNISRALFFNNRPFSSKSADLYKVINGEYFYY